MLDCFAQIAVLDATMGIRNSQPSKEGNAPIQGWYIAISIPLVPTDNYLPDYTTKTSLLNEKP